MRFNLLLYWILGATIYDTTHAKRLRSPTKMPTQVPSTQPTASPIISPKKPHILLIYADDFRDELDNAQSQAKLPHLRALKDRGVNFRNAITVDPVCGPSRNSARTGVRHPNTKTFDQTYRSLGYLSDFKVLRDFANYFVVDIGKVIHSYKDALRYHILYANDETSAPNPIITSGNNDCKGGKIGCVITEQASSDTAVTRNAINSLRRCVSLVNSGNKDACYIGVGYKHSHIQWAAYKQSNLRLPDVNTATPKVSYDGLATLLRHKSCNEMAKYKIGNHKLVAKTIKNVDQITKDRMLMQRLNNAYLAGLEGVDYQIGKLLQWLDAQKMQDGTYMRDNTIVLFTSDHGWDMGEQNEWCKRNPTPNSRNVPLIVAWPGVTFGDEASTLVSNDDWFCTLMEIVFGKQRAQVFTHPSGIKPTCVSFLPALMDPSIKIRKWSFSSVYRCNDPSNSKMINSCTSDTVDGSCDRPLIRWVGHTVIGFFNNQECAYTGWWPWNEIRIGCQKETWFQQPASLRNFGKVAPQIDLFKSGTIFSRNGVAVAPIQQELICHDANSRIGENDNPNVNNLVQNPAYANFVNAAIQAIKNNNPTKGGAFPYMGHRVI